MTEDNQSLAKGVAYRLRDEGFGVDLLHDGAAALDFLLQQHCDAIVWDINLPGRSGLEVLQSLGARGDPRPVLLLTARTETADRVARLDAGADDYLAKPFEIEELLANIRALLRRSGKAFTQSLSIGRLHIELSPARVIGATGPLEIPRRELNVLVSLAKAEGAPVSKERLLDSAYGVGSETEASVIEVYISRLRKRLAGQGFRINVQRGIGYSLTADAP